MSQEFVPIHRIIVWESKHWCLHLDLTLTTRGASSSLATAQVVEINDRSGERQDNYIDGNFICKHLYVIRPGVLLMALSDCESSEDIALLSTIPLPGYTVPL